MVPEPGPRGLTVASRHLSRHLAGGFTGELCCKRGRWHAVCSKRLAEAVLVLACGPATEVPGSCMRVIINREQASSNSV